jgi:replicative DNA helicase
MSNELELDLNLQKALPFDTERQLALLGHVIDVADNGFFLQVKDRLKPEWFTDSVGAMLYDYYLRFYEKYNRIPLTQEEFLGCELFFEVPGTKRQNITQTATICRTLAGRYGKDVLAKELTNWMRVRVYHEAVGRSARLFNGRQMEKAVVVLEGAVKEFQVTRFEGEENQGLSDPRKLIAQQKIDTEGALSTGLPLLDRKINDSCTNGALLRGDTTVILAPVNVGKTSTLISIARHNLSNGKSVLFVSLEGRDADIMEKIFCATLRISKDEFRRRGTSDKEMDAMTIDRAQKCITENLTFLHMVRPGLTAEEVVSVIRINQNQKKAINGRGYDLVIVDYPGILHSETKHLKMEFRQMQDVVYRQFVQLALEEKFHCIVAAQTNRDGSRNNRGGFKALGVKPETRLLTLEDIHESFAIVHSATTVITLNRSDASKAKGLMTFYVCKSRSSETGWAVVCETEFHKSLTHHLASRATAYRGSSSPEEQLENLLNAHSGKDIPRGYVMSDNKVGTLS